MGGSKPGSVTPHALGVEAAHRALARMHGKKGSPSGKELEAQIVACVNQLVVDHKLYWYHDGEKEHFIKQAQAHALKEVKSRH
ncbi:hypothetical protein CI109_105934 [Kwoniella shandongensis]|uniref:Uncharacterized protein n=1 Tax=Kwoniella shandongensis TaxID=1734106 RepID=A0A5M6BQ25_9TREE|nr:uncharacterized protein CI109_006636 [Kwoniella shandongensis]KAA5524996.1 hypothetical protein CI109_006636 [Kwoniella shandongensis]